MMMMMMMMYSMYVYSVSQKSSPPPKKKTLCDIFTYVTENYLGYCPNIFLPTFTPILVQFFEYLCELYDF